MRRKCILFAIVLSVAGLIQAAAPVGETIWLYSVETASYVTVDEGDGYRLEARDIISVSGVTEHFLVEDAGGGNILLKAAVNNNYAKVDPAQVNKMFANTTSTADPLAQYQWTDLGGGKIRLTNVSNGLNVLPYGNQKVLRANVSTTGPETEFIWGVVGSVDTRAPTPNPAAFSVDPTADSSSSVSMTATIGIDVSGPVEYYFAETSGNAGGTDSGWQTSPSYTDTELSPDTTYAYTIQMRDSAGNVGTVSAPVPVTTPARTDFDPPTPNPAAFAVAPAAAGSSAISMTATTGSDPSSPVEYLFTEISGNPGGTSSSWQTSTSYTDTGLTQNTQYTYTVQMRDQIGNVGTASDPISAKTDSNAYLTKVYQESGGIVVMEIENTPSPYGEWVLDTTTDSGNMTGSGALEFTGNTYEAGPAKSPLEYRFKINQPGIYFLQLHTARTNVDGRNDVANDCYIRMEGDYNEVPADGANDLLKKPAPMDWLSTNWKFFTAGRNPSDTWVWQSIERLDENHSFKTPVYEFKAGHEYTLIISGRSKFYKLNRVVINHIDYGHTAAQNLNLPESSVIEQEIPYVDAGPDKTVLIPDSEVVLEGIALDYGSIEAYAWTQVSGPNSAALSGADTDTLTASGLVEGEYTFRLTATDDDENSAYDEASVTVRPDPPVAEAGPSKSITVPESQVVLEGSGTDNSQVTAYDWVQVSGPNTASLSDTSMPTLTVSDLVLGVYTFGLTVWDDDTPANTDYDEVSVVVQPGGGSPLVTMRGDFKRWHKVTLELEGPESSETATPNPFADYRMLVTFTHPASGLSYTVPGYFAADGDAANSSATSGSKWHAHLSPDEIGQWDYEISFREGSDVAIASGANAGSAVPSLDGLTGSFLVAETDKDGADFRAKGRLEYVGQHFLKFAGTGRYFVKAGADAPENLLAYDDFDDTPNDPEANGNLRKSWAPHAGDYDAVDASEFTWTDPDTGELQGTELLGALRYLSEIEGLNSFSFLLFSLDGDDDNVFPHLLRSDVAGYESIPDDKKEKKGGELPTTGRWADTTHGVHHDRFDVSKMGQWEQIMSYADQKGMFMDVKTQETENDRKMDGGDLGRERKLYYRELIARFGHHLGLQWNLGEEHDLYEELGDTDQTRVKSYTQFFHDNDPYGHVVTIHSYPNKQNNVYNPLLGSNSKLTGASIQTSNQDFNNVFGSVKNWVEQSAAAGKPWVVFADEPGDHKASLRPDSDAGASHENGRKKALWGSIMAGGAGANFYFGYEYEESDLTCDDWRSRDSFWDYCRYMLEFFENHPMPLAEMSNDDSLTSNADSWCLAKPDETYLIYLKNGGTTQVDLSEASGSFRVKWYDPRNGGALQQTAIPEVTGGGTRDLGQAPNNTTKDWVILVTNGKILDPPTAPTGLVATPGISTVSLDWMDNTELDLAGYNVYRRTTSSGYSSITRDLMVSEFVDDTVSNGTKYYYAVTAVDTSGNQSGYSPEDSALPPDLTDDDKIDMDDIAILSFEWQMVYDINALLAIAGNWLVH